MNNKKYITISVLFILPFIVHSTDVSNLTSKNTEKEKDVNSSFKKDYSKIENTSTHSVREHVSEKTSINSLVMKNSTKTNQTSNSLNGFNPMVENKTASSHKSRELQNDSVVSLKKSSVIETNTTTGNSSTHIKKGLPIPVSPGTNSSVEKTISTSSEEPVAKKPLVTVHDDEADKIDSKNILPPPNLLIIDPIINEKKHKRSNYVVPIVAVILSVPLIAVVISILYKRSKDWWQHRNYRRMDYLIEGLYNS